eukprot:228742-Amorphochlora_amoeboformis.AAC.1
MVKHVREIVGGLGECWRSSRYSVITELRGNVIRHVTLRTFRRFECVREVRAAINYFVIANPLPPIQTIQNFNNN